MTAGSDSNRSMSGSAGAPDAAASPRAMRSMAASTRVRTASEYVRTLTRISASSGMMLALVPADRRPTVTTAKSAAGDLARHDRLEPQHRRRGHDHRIDRGVRHGPVTAAAVEDDPHGVGRGVRRPGVQADDPARQGRHVLAQDHVGRGEARVQAVVHHRLGAGAQLLGRLEDRKDGPRPRVALRRQPLAGGQEARDVHVVTTGVHDGDVLTVGIRAALRARVGEPGHLLHGQGVHVGAEQHHGAVAVAQQAHHPGAADPGRHVESVRREPFRDQPRRPGLLEAELRVEVEVLVELAPVSRGRHCISLVLRVDTAGHPPIPAGTRRPEAPVSGRPIPSSSRATLADVRVL